LVSLLAVMDKVLVARTDPFTIIIFPAFLTALILFLYQSLKFDGLQDVLDALRKGRWGIFAIALLGIVSDMLYILAVAVPGSLITLVIALRKTSTLVSTVIGGEIFHDHNLLQKIIASLVMLIGVYVILL